jgi:hypothetical protein
MMTKTNQSASAVQMYVMSGKIKAKKRRTVLFLYESHVRLYDDDDDDDDDNNNNNNNNLMQ